MMSTYTITTFEQLCERLTRADDDTVTLSVDDIDPRALACRIRIEGGNYGPRIPGYLLQALADLQTSTLRTYAFLANGTEDLRGLRKENLWTDVSVEVEEGALNLKFTPKGIFFELAKYMFKDLTPNRKLLAVLLPPLALIGRVGCRSQSGSGSEADEAVLKAFGVLDALAESNREFARAWETAEKNARVGVENIVRNAIGATKIDVGGRTYSAEDIRRIQAPEAFPPRRYSKEGEYVIVQINTEDADTWKVLFKDTKTGEKVPTSFAPEELFTSLDRAKAIFHHQRDERIIFVRFSVLERGAKVINSIDIFRPL